MSTEETYKLNLNVRKLGESETIPVSVEIRVKEGNIASISGSGGGEEYEGTLVLKPLNAASDKLSSDKKSLESVKSSLELCIVCDPVCHVEQC